MVVAAVDRSAAADVRRAQELQQLAALGGARLELERRRKSACGRLDRVARALVGEVRAGISPTTSSSQRARSSPVSVTSPITALSSSHFSQTVSTASSRSGATTATIRSWLSEIMISHGSMSVLAERHAVEVDVDARAVRRHLGERGGEAGGAAVLQRLDEPRLDELDRDLDQLLARERVADLDGRPLVGVVLAELLAREHEAPPIPSRPVVAP